MSTGSDLVRLPTTVVEHRAPAVVRDTVDGWLTMFEPVARLAESIAQTEFVPAGLRGKPAAITAAILYGREIGLGPIQSLQSIDVIDGRPAVSAEMGRALALAAGHELFVEESTTTRCVVRGRRVGSREWVTVTWTMDDAKRAGLEGRPNYRKHPRRMLQARATAELCHLLFSDALGGMPFTLEELSDDSDVAGNVGAAQPARTAQRGRRAQRPAELPPTTTPAPADDASPPLPGDEGFEGAQGEEAPADGDGEPIATKEQVKKLQTVFSKIDAGDRDERLRIATAILRRPVTTANDLTKAECSTLIDTLEKVGEGDGAADRLRALVDATEAHEEQGAPELPPADPVDAD